MKSKRKIPGKPRNRESKGRSIPLPQVKECRHMWMEGICMKCGCRQSDILLKRESAGANQSNE